MVQFSWIKMSLSLILMLQFTALATDAHQSVFTVRVGDDVALPCENVTGGQDVCDSAVWTFRGSADAAAAELVAHEQKPVKAPSDRLSVPADCSLLINKVTLGDAGRYACRQIRSGKGSEFYVYLSVIDMTQHDSSDKVILNCSVLEYKPCTYTVEWLYEGEEDISSDMETSAGSCSSSLTFTTSHLNQRFYESLKCNVTNNASNKVQLLTFSPPSSGWSWEHITFPALAALLVIAVVIITKRKTQGISVRIDGQNTAEDAVSLASLRFTNNTGNEYLL